MAFIEEKLNLITRKKHEYDLFNRRTGRDFCRNDRQDNREKDKILICSSEVRHLSLVVFPKIDLIQELSESLYLNEFVCGRAR